MVNLRNNNKAVFALAKPQNPPSLLKALSFFIAVSHFLHFLFLPILSLLLPKNSSSMEDDDEFGDLYTDVLRPFASTSSTAPQSFSGPPSSGRSIDLNLQTHQEEIPRGTSYPNSAVPSQPSDQTGAPKQDKFVEESVVAGASSSAPGLIGLDEIDEGRPGKEGESTDGAGVIERGGVELVDRALQNMNRGMESSIGDVRGEIAVKGDNLMERDVKFDIEEDGDGIEEVGSEPIIPGLSSGAGGYVDGVVAAAGGESVGRFDESGDRGEGDDWDSDSEDDLQIVLNDNNHMDMERGGMVGDGDEDDEDSELVIVTDGDPSQTAEVQEWGENTAQAADGERKDMGDSAKASGGAPAMPKVGYSNHGYHPFHSQFKVSVLCCLKGNCLYLGLLVSPSCTVERVRLQLSRLVLYNVIYCLFYY